MKKMRFVGNVVATAVASLFLTGQLCTEEKKEKSEEKPTEATICCEISHSCNSKDGCAGKEIMKVSDEKACKEKSGQVVECSKKE